MLSRLRGFVPVLVCLAASATPAPAIGLTGVAAITTIATNSRQIVGWTSKLVHHPKRQAKETAKTIREAVAKGKN